MARRKPTMLGMRGGMPMRDGMMGRGGNFLFTVPLFNLYRIQ